MAEEAEKTKIVLEHYKVKFICKCGEGFYTNSIGEENSNALIMYYQLSLDSSGIGNKEINSYNNTSEDCLPFDPEKLVAKRSIDGNWYLIEKIGFRSTVIRKFDKSIAIIPNFQFAENAVINISQTTNWIISWVINLQYDTTVDQLKIIRNEIEDFIKKDEDYKPDLGYAVRVDKFADSSIDMYIRCFTKTDDWDEWLAVKERLAISIKQIVEKHKASFAFPSQSIYVEKK